MTQEITVVVSPQEIDVTVASSTISVEVADPSKVGPAGATIVSAEYDQNGDIDFLTSDNRHIVVDLPEMIPTYIQDTQPVSDAEYVWWETDNGNLVTLWVNIP